VISAEPLGTRPPGIDAIRPRSDSRGPGVVADKPARPAQAPPAILARGFRQGDVLFGSAVETRAGEETGTFQLVDAST
jgi:hypothetical protein